MKKSQFGNKYFNKYKTYSLQNLTDIGKPDWKSNYTVNPKELGRGHFSKVYHACCKNTSVPYAAKVIRRRRGGKDLLEKIHKEAALMKQLNEDGVKAVVRLYDVHESFSDVVLILELAHGGCLYNVVHASTSGLEQQYVKVVAFKLLEALELMHRQNIVHLDIKADNILLRDSYPSSNIALCDFGLATQLKEGVKHQELVGTPDYMAPEIVNYENVSVNADMWSFGVLVHFLLSKISPFCGDCKEDTLTRVSRAKISFADHFSHPDFSDVKNFIQSLCVKAPKSRLTSQEAMHHSWFSELPDSPSPPPSVSPSSLAMPQASSRLSPQPSTDAAKLISPLTHENRCVSMNCIAYPSDLTGLATVGPYSTKDRSFFVSDNHHNHHHGPEVNCLIPKSSNLRHVVESPDEATLSSCGSPESNKPQYQRIGNQDSVDSMVDAPYIPATMPLCRSPQNTEFFKSNDENNDDQIKIPDGKCRSKDLNLSESSEISLQNICMSTEKLICFENTNNADELINHNNDLNKSQETGINIDTNNLNDDVPAVDAQLTSECRSADKVTQSTVVVCSEGLEKSPYNDDYDDNSSVNDYPVFRGHGDNATGVGGRPQDMVVTTEVSQTILAFCDDGEASLEYENITEKDVPHHHQKPEAQVPQFRLGPNSITEGTVKLDDPSTNWSQGFKVFQYCLII